jgi:16S rRNA (adenine1518-N6/adenine1519-N6)-dimethyltransferase
LERQTQSYLRNLFARKGIAPRHHLGQNFLVDLNIHDLIVETAGVGEEDVVLEVGPGAGALTAIMAGRGASVLAIEIDRGMAGLAEEAVVGLPGARVMNADALASKNTLNPSVVEEVRAMMNTATGKVFKLVANLPYNVATPIISNLLVHPEICPTLMVVTIQRELADRMIAAPSTPAYGALSILMQALAEVSIVRILPPSVFWPRPKVESAVVMIRSAPQRRAAIDVAWFHTVVRQVFLHRRKNLRHVLSELWSGRWSKPEVDALLASLGLDGRLRAEALDVEQFLRLAQALKERAGQLAGNVRDSQAEEAGF